MVNDHYNDKNSNDDDNDDDYHHYHHHHNHDDYNDTLYRDCQRQEWKVHKLLHKEISHTKDILDKNANESEERDEDIVF